MTDTLRVLNLAITKFSHIGGYTAAFSTKVRLNFPFNRFVQVAFKIIFATQIREKRKGGKLWGANLSIPPYFKEKSKNYSTLCRIAISQSPGNGFRQAASMVRCVTPLPLRFYPGV